MDEGKPSSSSTVSALFWSSSKEEVLHCLYQPFFIALAHDGALPIEAFRHYIGEDAFLLRAIADSYKSALSACPASKPHIHRILRELYEGVAQELQLHESYAQSWGVRLTQHIHPAPATAAIVDFLRGMQGASTVCILSAIVPSLRLFAFLGCQLLKAYPTQDSPYSEWIQTFSSSEYLKLPYLAEGAFDELAQQEEGEDLGK